MSLRSKIMVGYASIVLVLVVMVAWAITDFRLLGGAPENILRENYASILAAEAMIKHLERQDSATLLLIVEGRDAARMQFNQNRSEFLRWLARAEDNVTIPGEQDIVDEIGDNYSAYLMEYDEAVDTLSENADHRVLYRDRLLPLFEDVRTSCSELRELNHEIMVAESNRTKDLSRVSHLRMMAFAGGTLAGSLLLSLLLAHILTKPLRDMMDATSRLATGDYDVSIDARTDDELGELASRISLLGKKLRGFRDLNIGRLIQERKRLEAILFSIADGVVVIDDQLAVASINPAAAHFLEAWPDQVRGRHIQELIDDEKVYKAVKTTLSTGKPAGGSGKLRLVRESDDAESRHFRCAVTPVETEDGTCLGVVLVLQDLTRILAAEKLRDSFVMAASHELRTPLTGLLMSLKMLVERVGATLDEENKELLLTADEEARRLRSLVEDLLDLSKSGSGRLELSIRRGSLAELVKPALESLRNQIESKGIVLKTDVPTSLPDVEADPQKVTWIVTNLLSNALRYTDPGGTISLTALDIGEAVQVSVTDSGTGIPQKHLTRVFDPFVQIPSDDQHADGGLGIGLTLARSIVKAQGGTIWVDSQLGEGTVVTFTIPQWQGSTEKKEDW